MRIDANFPSPYELIENELRTLAFLKDDKRLIEHHRQLADDARLCYLRATPNLRKPRAARSLEFESAIDITTEHGSAVCHIGARITSNLGAYDELSYYMAICKMKRRKMRLLRKFHFDYTPTLIHRQPHPLFHMHYAGELSARLETLDLAHDHMDAWLSEPRLSFTPMSIALLLNMVMNEFRSEATLRFTGKLEWRKLLERDERLILDPYYRNLNLFLSNHQHHLVSCEFCYGYEA